MCFKFTELLMKKTILILALSLVNLHAKTNSLPNAPIPSKEESSLIEEMQNNVNAPGAVLFTPPAGWRLVDPKNLPKSVLVMVVGKGVSDFPPNMNLGFENYEGSLKDYIRKIVKVQLDSTHAEWKDLGTIQTEAGDAQLLQIDNKTKWGVERQMMALIKSNQTIYMLTASALRDEFPKHYKEFFNSIRSLKINPN